MRQLDPSDRELRTVMAGATAGDVGLAEAPLRNPAMVDLPRVLGRFGVTRPGSPVLLCIAGLHGNEPAGVLALQRVFRELEADQGEVDGLLVGLLGNRQALALGRRFVAHDLNRIWLAERLQRGERGLDPLVPDDLELWELDRAIRQVLSEAPGRVSMLDLHSTSAPGPAFVVFDDTLTNRELGLCFPVPVVLGLEEELEGTLANYLSARGVTAVGFEGGQHDDPMSVDRAEAAIWIALEACAIVPRGSRHQTREARRRLEEEHGVFPRVVEVRYRHAIQASDDFRMASGFSSFQPISEDQPVARDRRGDVQAPHSGRMLMPLYQEQGEDGFFLVREVKPFWLRASALLRRLGLERHLHLLPGVEPHPELANAFIVDRRIARWVALDLFHLLGFRRVGKPSRFLVMARRDYDRRRPPAPVASPRQR